MSAADGVKRSSIELLLLTLLQDEDMYGYQISQELERRSDGAYTLQESSMYPILYRMMDKGYISDKPVKVGKRRTRVYYHLEDAGAQRLVQARKEYLSLSLGVLKILGITEFNEMEEEVYGSQNAE